MGPERLLYWFEELDVSHNDIVGKKCANLGRMTQLGLDVPPGFAITIDLYLKFIHETGAAEEMSRYVKRFGDLKGQSIGVLEDISQTLQGIIPKLPIELAQQSC